MSSFLYKENVINLREYRTYLGAKALLKGYADKLMRIPDEQFDEERKRLATEWAYHKDNIFTLTKVELFKGARDARRAFFKPQT
jgi:hypothetical protein